VTEVAYSVGFNSLSHFHRSFRERFGAGPIATLRSSS
jgi:AraC-like DNA-binding protein